ncbi:hypothetical protein EDC01DRAFT_626504 [Geopyxis carbonaria]|nr:hypothetical protein EDC01DRAFT_626504 [Geopyxis carbonaria]
MEHSRTFPQCQHLFPQYGGTQSLVAASPYPPGTSSNFNFCSHCNQMLPYTPPGGAQSTYYRNLPQTLPASEQHISLNPLNNTTMRYAAGTSTLNPAPSGNVLSTGVQPGTPPSAVTPSFSSIKGLQHAVGQAMRGPKTLNALPVGQGKPVRKNKGRIPGNHNSNSTNTKSTPPLLNSPTIVPEHRYEVSLITSNSGDSRECLEHPGTEVWEPTEETLNIPVDNSNWVSFLRVQLLGSLGLWREFKDEWYLQTGEIPPVVRKVQLLYKYCPKKGPSRMPHSMLQQPELLRNLLEKHFRSTRLNVIPAMVIWVQHVPLQEQLDQIAESDAQYLVEAQARQANKVHNDNMLARQGKHCTRPTTLQELEVYRQEQAEVQSEPDVIPDVLQEWNQTEDSSDTLSTAPNTPPPLKQKKVLYYIYYH